MVFVASCNIQHYINIYNIPISPSKHQQIVIFITLMLVSGATGVYSEIDGRWTLLTWIYYGVLNVIIAAFFYFYHTKGKYNLMISAVVMTAIAVIAELLSINAMLDDPKAYLLVNLAGALPGWSLIYFLYVLGQTLVFRFQIQWKYQNILFFILAGILALFHIIGLKPYGKIIMLHQIGFIVVTTLLTILMFLRQR